MSGGPGLALFPAALLARLADVREVEIETIGRRSGQRRRTTVWIVVDDETPLVRSEYGEHGQWYRNALAHPRVVLWVDGQPHPALAARVTDPALLRRATLALREKYARHPALPTMVRAVVEPTTLALTPRSGDGGDGRSNA